MRSLCVGQVEDKAKAQEWARKLIQRRSGWLVLDTGHTGYGDEDTVTQVTLVSPKGEVLFNRSIPPRKSKGASLRKLLNDLQAVIGHQEVVTYNAEFRERIFDQTCEAWGCEPEFFDFDCAMLQYSAFIGEPGKYGDYKYQKLPKTGTGEGADCISVLNLIKLMAGSSTETDTTKWKPTPQPEPEWKKLPSNSYTGPEPFKVRKRDAYIGLGIFILLVLFANCAGRH